MKEKKKTGHDDSADLRKLAEEVLKESEKKFHSIFENVLDVYYETAIDGTILEVSPSIEILSKGQYHRDDLIGKSMIDFYADPGKRQTLLEALQERGNVVDYEIKLKNRDGLVIPCSISSKIRFDAQGRPEKILGTIRDITERKRVEEALRESEGRYRQLFDAESDAIFLIDNETGRILEANNAASALYGYSREELLTKKNTDLSSEPEETQQVTRGTPAISEQVITIPLRLHRKKDGTVFPVEITGRFFTWQGRSVHIAAIRDITERTRAEETLRKSEEKYSLLIETTHDMIFVIDRDGCVEYINTAAARALGEQPQNVIGKAHADLFPPEIAEGQWRSLQKVFESGEPFFTESRLIFPHGEMWASAQLVPFRREGGKVTAVMGVSRDITERWRAEEALRESEERFRRLSEAAFEGILIHEEGKIIDTNRLFATMFGYDVSEVIGGNALDFATLGLGDVALRHMRTESSEAYEGVAIRKDGSTFPVEVQAENILYKGRTARVTAIRDITERKQAEEALRESEEKYRTLVEKANEAIVIVQDGVFVFTNRRTSDLVGVPVGDLEGKPFIDFVWPEDRELLIANYRKRIAGETVRDAYDCRIIGAGGRLTWIFLSAAVIRWKGKPATLNLLTDITERKQAEEEVRRKAKELQEKNDELTRFTHAVAHDLRSPLVTIQTFQGHLERDIRSRDAARVEEDLGFIRNAADKMGRLLDDIRRLSRVGHITNPSEEAPLQAIVKEALDLVAGRITGRGVKVQVTEEPVVLYGDRTRLVEVFLNLVDNAVKFMGDEPAPRVEIGVEQTGEELVLHVRDNGIGIDPQVQPLLFSLFHKLDPKMEGEGIGLALVRRIAELHGGRIWVESEGLGKGTTFRFTLAKTRRRRAEEEKP